MQYLHIQKGITISEPFVLTISSRPAAFTLARILNPYSIDSLSASKVQFSIERASNSFFVVQN
jgi:hypothetical protein